MVVTSHLLEWLGGVTYDRYFAVWYSYFIVYFLLLIGIFVLIFRHPGYVALATTLSAGLMSFIPFIWYFQGPGLNPVRHLFDVFVIAGFYLYLAKERQAYLIGALFFSILGILNNPQLGLACLGSLVTAVGVVWFKRAIDFDWRILAAVLVTVLLSGYIGLGHPFWNGGNLEPILSYGNSGIAYVRVEGNHSAYYLRTVGYYPVAAYDEWGRPFQIHGAASSFVLAGSIAVFVVGLDVNSLFGAVFCACYDFYRFFENGNGSLQTFP